MEHKNKPPKWATHQVSAGRAALWWAEECWAFISKPEELHENFANKETWERHSWIFKKIIRHLENK